MDKTEKIFVISLILPFALFLIFGSIEARLEQLVPQDRFFFSYPAVYSLKILLVGVATLCCLPFWLRAFRFRWTRWTTVAFFSGFPAAALWVLLSAVPLAIPGLAGSRAAFNPFDSCSSIAVAWSFWGVRMVGLALLTPLFEEMFLRGFLLRFVEGDDWKERPVGDYSSRAWGAVCIYAAFTHPELCAAIVWFGLGTWLVSRTKNIWDAVAFHVGTNAGLGIYVLFSGAWNLL